MSATLSTLERGLAVAELVASRQHASLAEVAAWAGVSEPTAYRVLSTLEQRGWVVRDKSRSGYRPGPVLMHLTGMGMEQRLALVSDPAMAQLSAAVRETTNLAVLHGRRLVYVRIVDGLRPLRFHVEAGTDAPIYATGLGKAVLAVMPSEEAAAVLGNGPYPALTAKTMTTPAQVLATLDGIREKGYGVDHGEGVDGAVCVAAAVLGPQGGPVGAVSVCGPETRLGPTSIPAVATEVVAAARDITARLRSHITPIGTRSA